jgi:hypothetical protein
VEHAFLWVTKDMGTTSIDWKGVRKELAGKRTELFERFEKHPGEIHLATEIKLLDDEMLECNEHMQRERNHQD